MKNPAGTHASNRPYSVQLRESLHAITRIMSDSMTEKSEIHKDGVDYWTVTGTDKDGVPIGEMRHVDGEYSIKEKKKELERIDSNRVEQTKPHVQKFESIWNKVKAEYIIPFAGSSKNDDTLTIMQLILNSDGTLSQETLANALKPIQDDFTAIQTIYPLIIKTGLTREFSGTHAQSVLNAGNRLKASMRNAEEMYSQLGNSFAQYEENPIAAPMVISIFLKHVETAETALSELKDLIA